MKKIIALLLVFAFLFSMASCNFGPAAQTTPAGTTPEVTTPEVTTPEATTEHVHEFVLSEADSTPAQCEAAGLEVSICSCGEREEKEVEALGHNMKVQMENKPSCTETGTTILKCSNCGKREYITTDALNHNYATDTEASRLVRCLNEGCPSCYWAESNGKHTEALTFNFGEEDKKAIDDKYNEVLALIEAAPKYDPALHGFAEEGALADEFAAVDAVHTELYDLIMNAISQRQLAEIAYYCDMDNKELEETHAEMLDYHTQIVAKFYTLSRPFYDSCYREFYYQGMSEEEINSFLFDSDAVSNPEYTALKERNNAIETEFLALSEMQQKERVAEMYAEFAANNNKMAQLMGYENYLEYAYENVYGRDYTYQDAAELADMVKEYIAPVFAAIYKKWDTISVREQADIDTYYSQVQNSFFEDLAPNTLVNDYIDLMAFTSNPDKQISFSDEFNKLMGDGNMFRGEYQGAFVTTISGVRLPIAYFGEGYDNAFTIVHEFGHFMNEIYSADVAEENPEVNQSFDLLEMHSQGNELLYLTYLKENAGFTEVALNLVETYTLVNMFYIVMAGMTIDVFEQAIYLNQYDGLNADVIMADGQITYDEYDFLYKSICTDFGALDVIGDYWQYGMTITSACYYISYSVSALSVLQLYDIANTQGFDVAKDAYLKLFTYVDENPEMTMEEILTYAGMRSFKDEQLYISMNEYFLKK